MKIKNSFFVVALAFSNVNAEQMSLNIISNHTIKGRAPYISLDRGTNPIASSRDLLYFKVMSDNLVSENSEITYTSNTTSSESAPITLPQVVKKLSDITTIINKRFNVTANAVSAMSVNLSELKEHNKQYFNDKDGDNNFDVTGSITMSAIDGFGKNITAGTELNSCDAPYKLVLSNTDIALSTQYGVPKSATYQANKVTYYIKPKTQQPQACYAQPDLSVTDGSYSRDEFVKEKGFKVIDVNEPKKNFPRTGFDNAYFYLILANTNADDVIKNTSVSAESGSGLSLKLEKVNYNKIKLTLSGPNELNNGVAFTPSTFKIKTTGGKVIYSFEVSKWFIARSKVSNQSSELYSISQNFCFNLNQNYRLPSIAELSNGNYGLWTYSKASLGKAAVEYMRHRAIGNGRHKELRDSDDGDGGLFSEWGNVKNYKNAIFQAGYYWGAYELERSLVTWYVSARQGYVGAYVTELDYGSICVSTGKEYLPIIAPTTSTHMANKAGEYFDIENNPSSVQKPIQLQAGKTFADVNIKDGVDIKITDANGKSVPRDFNFNCENLYLSPYKLTLSKGGRSADYYFEPKIPANAQQNVCNAQQTLQKKN